MTTTIEKKCISCKKEIKEVNMGGVYVDHDIFFHCNNPACPRFGLLTIAWLRE